MKTDRLKIYIVIGVAILCLLQATLSESHTASQLFSASAVVVGLFAIRRISPNKSL